MPNKGDLRVWWIPQIPMKPFTVPVKDIGQAVFLLRVLADYDDFQLKTRVKGDYSNAGGLSQYDPDDIERGVPETGWTEWYDAYGNNIDYYLYKMEVA